MIPKPNEESGLVIGWPTQQPTQEDLQKVRLSLIVESIKVRVLTTLSHSSRHTMKSKRSSDLIAFCAR